MNVDGQRILHRILLLLIAILLSGCTQSFNIKNLAKSDVDMVADSYVSALYEYNRSLIIKLYKRNPRELAKHPGMTVDVRLRQLGATPPTYKFSELNNQVGNDAITLAFDPAFTGDRVFALMVGIRSMLHAAYNGKTEFYLLDDLDQQKLYNSARNLEIITWRLNTYKLPNGELFLLTNGYYNGIPNLSFERLFGKMIGLQDMMAQIVAGKTNRTINSVLHGVASTTLLPVGL